MITLTQEEIEEIKEYTSRPPLFGGGPRYHEDNDEKMMNVFGVYPEEFGNQ